MKWISSEIYVRNIDTYSEEAKLPMIVANNAVKATRGLIAEYLAEKWEYGNAADEVKGLAECDVRVHQNGAVEVAIPDASGNDEAEVEEPATEEEQKTYSMKEVRNLERATPAELSTLTGVPASTLRRWADRGYINAGRDFRGWRFFPEPLKTAKRIQGLLNGDIKLEQS